VQALVVEVADEFGTEARVKTSRHEAVTNWVSLNECAYRGQIISAQHPHIHEGSVTGS
jgi:hypothetical protein